MRVKGKFHSCGTYIASYVATYVGVIIIVVCRSNCMATKLLKILYVELDNNNKDDFSCAVITSGDSKLPFNSKMVLKLRKYL